MHIKFETANKRVDILSKFDYLRLFNSIQLNSYLFNKMPDKKTSVQVKSDRMFQ